jgi:hypothetical protein
MGEEKIHVRFTKYQYLMKMWCEIYFPQPCKITESPVGPESQVGTTYSLEFRAGHTSKYRMPILSYV